MCWETTKCQTSSQFERLASSLLLAGCSLAKCCLLVLPGRLDREKGPLSTSGGGALVLALAGHLVCLLPLWHFDLLLRSRLHRIRRSQLHSARSTGHQPRGPVWHGQTVTGGRGVLPPHHHDFFFSTPFVSSHALVGP